MPLKRLVFILLTREARPRKINVDEVKEAFMANPKTFMTNVAQDMNVRKATISRTEKEVGGRSLRMIERSLLSQLQPDKRLERCKVMLNDITGTCGFQLGFLGALCSTADRQGLIAVFLVLPTTRVIFKEEYSIIESHHTPEEVLIRVHSTCNQILKKTSCTFPWIFLLSWEAIAIARLKSIYEYRNGTLNFVLSHTKHIKNYDTQLSKGLGLSYG
ncbi:unnamed protein product [Lepeophtheirus salmonis]|uniref:(salmon louse) hypothetical protein n=1 Tax=Lepeophtheirus salmonis TaxID=72036 RepID=A0A7R8H9F9_LEPSM|nr:unnamed protein product [Lepeophtheirus salmonis]CAF2948743.1 unnamed protein product [Lepeophtheirus salmonis]